MISVIANVTRAILIFLFFCVLTAPIARGDEQVRQVQEELRKRNLYFGDIDGHVTPDLVGALKRYQARKGFDVTGAVDEQTASSLHISTVISVAKTGQNWPDLPVLKSDAARQVSQAREVELQRQAEENPDLIPTPPPPAESPGSGQNVTPERVAKLVHDYLRDGETQDVATQVHYYAFPVEYFDHGQVDEKFVARDTSNYVKRWPERKYTLVGQPQFIAAAKDGETAIEFTIGFNVRNKGHAASGKTRNFWTVRTEGEDLKIVAIREERVRD
ncbi:MAG: peptidoglycan-binding protein [Chthoniobacterales bacterium]